MIKFYHQKIVPNKTPIFIGMAILFIIGIALGLTVFSLKKTLAADETCYWVGDTNPAVWNDATHWSNASGGGGSTCAAPGGLPDTGTAVIFNASGLNGVTVNVDVSVDSINLASGYTGTFDNATQDKAFTVANSVTMDNTRTDMGDATWTVSGSFDIKDVTTFNRNLSTLVMNGTGKELIGYDNLNNVTISNGATITVPALAGGIVWIFGQLNVSGTLSVASPSWLYVADSLSDIKVTATGSITGTGEMIVEYQSKITQKDGVIDIASLNILADHTGSYSILPATYESATVIIGLTPTGPGGSYDWDTSAGTYTFNGNVTFQADSGGADTYTINNSANANFVFKGNVTFSNGSGTLAWTKGNGTITAGGGQQRSPSTSSVKPSMTLILPTPEVPYHC